MAEQMSDDGYHEIVALRAQLTAVTRERDEAVKENQRVRELMTETGGDLLQALSDSLYPGVRALVSVFRLYRGDLHEARALLKEYRDEYSHTPRCMKESAGPCTCGYDANKT